MHLLHSFPSLFASLHPTPMIKQPDFINFVNRWGNALLPSDCTIPSYASWDTPNTFLLFLAHIPQESQVLKGIFLRRHRTFSLGEALVHVAPLHFWWCWVNPKRRQGPGKFALGVFLIMRTLILKPRIMPLGLNKSIYIFFWL